MNERRMLPRVPQDQPVRITLLHPPLLGDQDEASITGICVNMSLAGACFRVNREIPPGTLVRVETDDALWLGEVVYPRPDEDAFVTGLHFEHSVIGLGQLQRTLQRLDWNPQDETNSRPAVGSRRM